MDDQNTVRSKDSSDKPTFEIKQIYVKEQSCKVPHAPAIFSDNGKPEVNFELDIKHEQLEKDLFQVVLRIHSTSKINHRTALIIEVEQAGLFKLNNLDEQQQKFILNARCAAILSGYARKVIADAATEAGFGPIHLTPIDFEGLYMSKETDKAKPEVSRSSTKLFDIVKKPNSVEEIN